MPSLVLAVEAFGGLSVIACLSLRSPTALPPTRHRKIHLFRQAQSPYQGLVSRVGTDWVKRGVTDAEYNFNFLVGKRFLQIVQRPARLACNRKRQSRPGILVRLIETVECQTMKTLRIPPPPSPC